MPRIRRGPSGSAASTGADPTNRNKTERRRSIAVSEAYQAASDSDRYAHPVRDGGAARDHHDPVANVVQRFAVAVLVVVVLHSGRVLDMHAAADPAILVHNGPDDRRTDADAQIDLAAPGVVGSLSVRLDRIRAAQHRIHDPRPLANAG